jgi:tripartite-type tricarboxylate transporter receptor subunit TctC
MQQAPFKEITGQDLVVQYMAGAGGAAAWSQLNEMEADGHTIMGTNLPHIILQPLQSKETGYQTEDLTNVYFFQYTPDALIVPADSPHMTVDDFVEAAKAQPGVVITAGSGTFSGNHLAQQRFNELAGINTTYVPMAGTAPSVTALLGNQVNAIWSYSTVGVQQGDKVRVLAVAMDERHPAMPDVPTCKELGYDLTSGVYRGIAVPKATPEDVR